MKIGILGTGMVGRALAAKLVEMGHEVLMGTRDVAKTMTRNEKDVYGNPPFPEWHRHHSKVTLDTLSNAASHGEVVINATNGAGSLEALRHAGNKNLEGKTLIDISNPLDFSKGMPPSLFVSNTDSLGEQIQREFPGVKVVKTLNCVTAHVMVGPRQLANGDHTMFVSGNDAEAKKRVIGYLKSWFGWEDVIDLGDITAARGIEMTLPLWVRLFGSLQTPMFGFKIVRNRE